MTDDLETELERIILAHCFTRDGEQIEGVDFAAEEIAKMIRQDREDDYRSTVLDLTTRE